MRWIEKLFLEYPFYRGRPMFRHLRRDGVGAGRLGAASHALDAVTGRLPDPTSPR